MLTILFEGSQEDQRIAAKQISDKEIGYIIEAQQELDEYLRASPSPQFIARTLDVMAEVFQAQVPSADALSQWVKFLKDYPEDAIRHGARQILRSHKWRSLPLPADFEQAITNSQFWLDIKSEASMYGVLLQRIERLSAKKERGNE